MYSLAVKRMILFFTLLLLLLLAGCVQEGVETPGHHVHVKWLLTPIASSDGTLRSFSLQSANKNEFQWGNIELSLGPYDSENENLTIITSDDIALFKESGYFLNIKVFDDYYESTPWDIVLPVDDSFLWELTRTLERSGLTNKNDLFDEVEVDLSVSSHFLLNAEYSSGKKIHYSLPEDSYGFSEDFFRQIHPLLYKELNKHSHSFVPLLNVFPGISPDPKWIQAFSFYRHSDKLEDNSHFSFTRVSGEPVFSGRYYSADTQKLIFCDHVVLTPKEEQTLLTLFVQSKFFFLSEEKAKTLDLQISEGIEEIHLISLSTEKKHDQVENYRIVSSPCTDPDCGSSFFLLLRDLTEKYVEIQ